MPQMSPLPWVSIYVFVGLVSLSLVVYLYFFFNPISHCEPLVKVVTKSNWDW